MFTITTFVSFQYIIVTFQISEDSDSVERDGGVEPTESHDQGVDGVEPTESHDQGVGGEQVAESSNQQQPHQPLVYQRSTSSLESEQSSSGLPEDEVSMEIPTSSAHAQPPLRPTSFPRQDAEQMKR